MAALSVRLREQGFQSGVQQGFQQGEANLILRQVQKKFGAQPAEAYRQRIEQADLDMLALWSERILTADTLEEVFR